MGPALHSQPIWNAPFMQEGESAASWDRPTTSAQGSAAATEKLARPVRHVYIRNSATVGGAGWVCTLPRTQMARIMAEICKAEQRGEVRKSCYPRQRGKGIAGLRIAVASRGEYRFLLPWFILKGSAASLPPTSIPLRELVLPDIFFPGS